MRIQDYIKYHTALDFENFTGTKHLDEVMRHINNIDVYANTITNKIVDYLISKKRKYLVSLDLIIYKNEFNIPNVFFDEIHFYNSRLNINDAGKSVEYCGYMPDKSGIDYQGKYVITLEMFGAITIEEIKSTWPPLFAHEITHAYEDYCKHKTAKIEDKSFDDEYKFRPGYAYKAMGSTDEILVNFAEILYFSFDAEVSAMENEIFQELLSRRTDIEDFASGNEQIKQTKVYKRISNIDSYLNTLKYLIDKNEQEKLKHLYYLVYGTYIKDYDKLLLKVNTKYDKARNKIISAVGNGLCCAYGARNLPERF